MKRNEMFSPLAELTEEEFLRRTGGTGSLPWGSGPALRGRRFRFCWGGRDRHRSEGDAVARGDGQRKRSRTPPSFGKAVEESAR